MFHNSILSLLLFKQEHLLYTFKHFVFMGFLFFLMCWIQSNLINSLDFGLMVALIWSMRQDGQNHSWTRIFDPVPYRRICHVYVPRICIWLLKWLDMFICRCSYSYQTSDQHLTIMRFYDSKLTH